MSQIEGQSATQSSSATQSGYIQTANAGQAHPHHHHHHGGGGAASAGGAGDALLGSPANDAGTSGRTTAAPSADQSVSQAFAADIVQAIQAYGSSASATGSSGSTM